MAAHSMPPSTPASRMRTTTKRPLASVACMATPPPKMAPRMNWPSAPMFQRFERKQTARPSAMSTSGVAFTASSDRA